MALSTVRVDVHLEPDELARALQHDARRGLTSHPKELPPKWFYDDRGSALFDEITRLPEYYLTRCEREILTAHAGDIASVSAADTLVELGSGMSEKTRILLDAFTARDPMLTFVPFDVSEGVLREASDRINGDYPAVEVHAVVGDFERHLGAIPDGDRRLIAFLGSTIGNLTPAARAGFFADIASTMDDDDTLLVGFDLVKDAGRLRAAYDDPRGVTADFNRNVLRVLNRELAADFDIVAFEHVASWEPGPQWMQMSLRSTRDQTVRVEGLDLDVPFAAGELLQTEISAKFRREGVEAELISSSLELTQWWTDAAGDFGLGLARRR